VTVNECEKYWHPAAKNVCNEPSVRSPNASRLTRGFRLDTALGVRIYHEYIHTVDTGSDEPLSYEWKKLLTSLAGPHGKTILKIYRIQKGLDK
jgi:hypothetical protein